MQPRNGLPHLQGKIDIDLVQNCIPPERELPIL